MRIDERIAIVTGAGSGIGRAIALRFAVAGAHVVVADIAADRAQETATAAAAAGGRATPLTADIAAADQVQQLVDQTIAQHDRIDILVNCAAISEGEGIVDLAPEVWDRNFSVDLRAPYLCMRAVLPHMVAAQRGVIINIASVNGLLGLGEYAYSAAKAGLISLTQNVAVEFGPAGVRANVICPGTVRTPIWNERVARQPDLLERLARWYPLRRVAEPEEIASTALFLASDESSFITGATLVVDGGLTAGMGRISQELAGRNDMT